MVQPNGLPGCWSDAWNWVCCASGQGGPRAPNRESKGRCRSKLSLKAAAELPLPLPACHFFLCTLQGPPQHLPDIKRLAPPPTHPPTHPLTDTSAAPTTRLLYPDTQTPPAPGQWLVRAAAVLPHQLVTLDLITRVGIVVEATRLVAGAHMQPAAPADGYTHNVVIVTWVQVGSNSCVDILRQGRLWHVSIHE